MLSTRNLDQVCFSRPPIGEWAGIVNQEGGPVWDKEEVR